MEEIEFSESDWRIANAIENVLKGLDLPYVRDEAYPSMEVCGESEGIAILLAIAVLKGTIMFYGGLDLEIKGRSKRDLAWRVNSINRDLMVGSMFMNPEDGSVDYRSTHYAEENVPSDDLLEWYISNMVVTIVEKSRELQKWMRRR